MVSLVIGLAALVLGVQFITSRSFPRWMTGPLLWPLDRITPGVVVAEGWACVVLAATALTYPFVVFAPAGLRYDLTGLTLAALLLSLCLVVLAVWLSRRPAPSRR